VSKTTRQKPIAVSLTQSKYPVTYWHTNWKVHCLQQPGKSTFDNCSGEGRMDLANRKFKKYVI